MSAAPDDLALLISDLRPGENELERRAADAINSLGERLEEANNRAARAEVAIEALQRQLAEAKQRVFEAELSLKNMAKAAGYLGERLTTAERQLSASRADGERLRAGIERYLAGDYPNPRQHRPNPCEHGTEYYVVCARCDDAYFKGLLNVALSPPAAETPKTAEDGA